VGGKVRDKWQHQINTGSVGPVAITAFATVPHELHRVRRLAISKFFSRQQMLKLETEVHDFAQRVADKLLRSGDGRPFDIKHTFNCFTADVISQYAFGNPMGFVDQESWEPDFGTWISSFFKSAYLVRHSVVVRKLANLALPLADYMGHDIKAVMRQLNIVIPEYVKAALRNPEKGRVFAEIVKSDILPLEEKTLYRLSGEGFNFLLAGTETTSVRHFRPECSADGLLTWDLGLAYCAHLLPPRTASHLCAINGSAPRR
jgi:cytochrome P450